jgi:glycosyltransferase involved in cell wall biosynthesis
MGMTVGVHQVVAGAAPRDAITNHVLAARNAIRAMGIRSEVFADDRHIASDLLGEIHPHPAWNAVAGRTDLAILHYSIDSPAFEYVVDRANRSALHYHNVTPAELLWRDAPALALQCRDGRSHLGDFVGRVSHTAADSQFNADEIEVLGYPKAEVIGILRRPDEAIAGRSRTAGAEPVVLFVGRGAPNKCQDDAILAVAALAQAGTPATLRLVGGWGGNRAYRERCERTARLAGVEQRVAFLDSISDEELAREYAQADLFLCLSEHEGYCVPLLEAMAANLPIIGYDAGAVPETMGDAGLLLTDKTPSLVAEAMTAVLAGELGQRMAQGRQAQLMHHSPEAVRERLARFVETFAA